MLLTLALFSLPQDPLVPIDAYVIQDARFVDLNGDGVLDRISTVGGYFSSIRIALGSPAGFVGHATVADGDVPAGFAFGDLDNDGDVDLFTHGLTGSSTRVWLNDGNANFAPQPLMPAQFSVVDYAVLDYDGDGDQDLFCSTSGGTRGVFQNLGGASFLPYSVVDTGGYAGNILVADFDGDQIDDLVLGGLAAGGWLVMLGSPQGLGVAQYGVPYLGDIAVGDVDGDGTLDIVLAEETPGTLTLHRGVGGGFFDGGTPLVTGEPGLSSHTLLDRDGDGDLDLLWTARDRGLGSTATPEVLSGSSNLGAGVFGTRTSYARSYAQRLETNADLDGNGFADAVLVGDSPLAQTAYLASPGADCNANGVPDTIEIAGGLPDCDGDGLPDECELDADGSGIPDECELALGLLVDCDGNGTADVSDFAIGLHFDWNSDGVSDTCVRPPLWLNMSAVSMTPDSLFATLFLEVNAGAEKAGDFVFFLGSLSGTSPGLTAEGVTLPLNYDGFFQFLLLNPFNSFGGVQGVGLLDGAGRLEDYIEYYYLPLELFPANPSYAALSLDPTNGALTGASNPVSVRIDYP